MKAEAERWRLKLRKIFHSQKALARRASAQKKRLSERIAEARVFFPADFRKGRTKAKEGLEGIMKTYKRVAEKYGSEIALNRVCTDKIIRKWFINLLLLLIFSAGGQRPQVYAQLQTPNSIEISDMKEKVRNGGYFELRPGVEKTIRSVDMPNVIVPGFVLKYVEFHVEVMRKRVIENACVQELNANDMPLIVHTENGEQLSTPQITKTLKAFLSCQMPEAENVTMMSLRSSYGTSMMHEYRQKKYSPISTSRSFWRCSPEL